MRRAELLVSGKLLCSILGRGWEKATICEWKLYDFVKDEQVAEGHGPVEFEIVDAEYEAKRDLVRLIIESDAFPTRETGEVHCQFEPTFCHCGESKESQ
jgi:hypothetical protein